jgi:hypothetical protein
MTTILDDILGRLQKLPEDERLALKEETLKQTAGLKFVPSPGPQTEAYFSKADVLLYGGQGGGGKSALLLGLGLNEHKRSMIMRRHYSDLEALTDELIKLNGSRDGFTSSPQPRLTTADGRLIKFGAAQHLGDEQKKQGQAHDLLGIDEAAQFLELQIRFLMGWVRSTEVGQRTRTVLASNPPLSSDGQWLVGMFRPWLDLTHHKPAKAGELRWFITDESGKDFEVEGPNPVTLQGKTLIPMSRTFIPAALKDNPFLINTGYQAKLDALPEPIRSAVRDGNFMAARQDDACQVIPSAWVMAAQKRWTPDIPQGVAMTALAVDIAQGGADDTVLASRYGGYFPELTVKPGKDTPDGNAIAVMVISNRRDKCPVILDMGGGYGGGAKLRLQDNEIETVGYNGGMASTGVSRDGAKLKFKNKRAEAHWRLREALDPQQEGGSIIALPNDAELLADLCAVRFDPVYMERRIVKIEEKSDIKARIARSPGRGDSVVMCLAEGGAAVLRQIARSNTGRQTQVVRGYQNRKR